MTFLPLGFPVFIAFFVAKIWNFNTAEMNLDFFCFFAQDELFSKNKRELKSKEGKTLERSNTEFFSLRRHVTNPGVNDAMVNIIILKCKTKTNGSVKVNQWPKHFAVTRGRDPLLVGRKNNDRSGRFPIT